jgi:outer membrane protein assembly factor BamB
MPRISTSKFKRAALLALLFGCVLHVSVGATFGLENLAQAIDQKKEFAKCWQYKAAVDVSVQSESDASNVYFVDVDRRLIAVDLHAGAVVWSTDLGGAAISNLLVTHDSVIVATGLSDAGAGNDAVLRSVSKQTGITNWFLKITNSSNVFIGAVNGTVIVVVPSGTVSAFATSSGELRWSKDLGTNLTTDPYFRASTIYVGTERNEVIAITGSSGDITIAAKTQASPSVVFSDSSGHLLTGDDRGNLVRTSSEGKRVWRFRNGARISAISTYDSEFLATSNDNFVYKLTRGGNVEWKRRLSSRIDGRPLILDNVAVFATVGDGNVYVIDLSNGKIINRFENGENNPAQAISAGNSFVMLTAEDLTLFSRASCPSK